VKGKREYSKIISDQNMREKGDLMRVGKEAAERKRESGYIGEEK